MARPARPLARRARAGSDRDGDLETWVAAARCGDTDAFGWIWTQLSPRVSGYLRARGVTSPDDVTSEVFLSAFTSLGSFSGGAADFRSWLFTIAHHRSVDDRRRRRDTEEYTPESDPRTSSSAESVALDALVGADVADLLACLTDDQREVLVMRVLGDLSVEQVAIATGRTVGAVKQLYHRAIAATQRSAASPGVARLPATAFPGVTALRPLSRSPGSNLGQAVTQAASTTMTEL